MRIVVSGAAGRLGQYCTRELTAAGHQVLGIDLRLPRLPSVAALTVDLTDAGQVYSALAGADAVVHMGAWANAGLVPDTRTYGDNVAGTFHVLQACADLGIRRVVAASSAQVYGFAGNPPAFVPAEEQHPLRPLNCYALSKMAGEEAARYFSSRRGLQVVSFRIMGARTPPELEAEIERVARNPAADTGLLWTRVDARDVALAARLALEADEVAPGPYNITGAEVVVPEASRSLVERFCGGATQIRAGLDGRRAPVTCARAQRAFGYTPRYVWSTDTRHPE